MTIEEDEMQVLPIRFPLFFFVFGFGFFAQSLILCAESTSNSDQVCLCFFVEGSTEDSLRAGSIGWPRSISPRQKFGCRADTRCGKNALACTTKRCSSGFKSSAHCALPDCVRVY